MKKDYKIAVAGTGYVACQCLPYTGSRLKMQFPDPFYTGLKTYY